MRLLHAGLVCSSEASAERFFGAVLGLQLNRRARLTRELARDLFGVDTECDMLYYAGGDLLLEVFVTKHTERRDGWIDHLCLAVPDREALLTRCRDAGFAVREVPKGDSVVVFVEDDDGNLYEIKEG